MRLCFADTQIDSEVVTREFVGECVEHLVSFDFEFSQGGSFTRLHMRCPRCKTTWIEHREFQQSDIDLFKAAV